MFLFLQTWQDLRSRTKIKKSELNKQYGGTGGGPPLVSELTPSEQAILDIVKVVSIEGHNVLESPANFNFENTEDITNDSLLTNNENFTEDSKGSTPRFTLNHTGTNNDKNTPSTSGRKVPKRSKMSNEVVVNNFNTLYKQKTKIKEEYYNKKIELLTRIAVAKEKSASSLDKIAESLTSTNLIFQCKQFFFV